MGKTTGGFIFMAFLLVAVIIFGVTGTVKGQVNLQDMDKERWYRQEEARLLQEARGYLEDIGYHNSGVTLTRVVDGAGARAYTFTVHHSRIDRMAEKERENLRRELAGLTDDFTGAVPGEVCTFRVKFLAGV